MSADTYVIDANIILRHLLGDNEELSPKAKAILESVEDGLLTVICEPVTLAEAVWVLKSFYKLSPEQISGELLGIVALERFLLPNKPLYMQALKLYGGPVPHFGDACACAAALEQCDGRMLSFDRRLSRVDGISRDEDLDA